MFAAAAALGAMAAGSAQASTVVCGSTPAYLLHYDLAMTYDVSAIATFNESPGCSSTITNSFTAPVGASTINDPFEKRDFVGRSLLMGIATDLPGDPAGQQHLVLFTNDVWAAKAEHIAFGTLFPTVNEGDVIAALASLAAGTGTTPDYIFLFNFAQDPVLNSPNGDAAFMFGDTFTAIAFSDGAIVGAGNSYSTAVGSAVPEPASWVMVIVGIGVIGAAARRRRCGPAVA
jgi:hypothetical protein